jgi:signal transduction histidine kinase
VIADDGPGLAKGDALARAEAAGHLGIAGMRARIAALGGEARVDSSAGRGVVITIDIPISEDPER